MTFREAFLQLADGYAMKRPSWKGYIERTDTLDANDQPTGVYQLRMHYADGTTTVLYAFDNDDTNNVVKSGTSVMKGSSAAQLFVDYAPITHFLFDALVADDFEVNLATTYAAVVAGSGEF